MGSGESSAPSEKKSNNYEEAVNLVLEGWEPSAKELLSPMAKAAAGPGIDASQLNRNAQLHQQAAQVQAIQQQRQQGLQRAQHERSTQQAPPPAYEASTLPEGWKQYTDATSGKHYYHHAATNTTQWDRPHPHARAV